MVSNNNTIFEHFLVGVLIMSVSFLFSSWTLSSEYLARRHLGKYFFHLLMKRFIYKDLVDLLSTSSPSQSGPLQVFKIPMGQNVSVVKSFTTAFIGSVANDEHLREQVKGKIRELPKKVAMEEMKKGNPKMATALGGFEKAQAAYAEVGHVVKNGEVDWESLKQVQQRKMHEVIKEFEKHAGSGHVTAMVQLGEIYEEGKGIKKDYEQAQKFYKMAAGEGMAEAKYKLGMMYKNGKGLEEDLMKAADLVLDAANQGYPDAQERMGKFYEKGKGVGEDHRKAVEYYQKAAKQGHERAKDHLRRLNELGDAPPGWNEE